MLLSGGVGLGLAGQPSAALDQHLAAGPGPMVAWPSPALLATADDGRSWRRSLSGATGLWGIDFADQVHGWAVGVEQLYRTKDGGATWSRAGEPGPGGKRALVRVAFADAHHGVGLQGVAFSDPAHGLLVIADGDLGPRRSPQMATDVWSTADGGGSWQLRYRGPPSPLTR